VARATQQGCGFSGKHAALDDERPPVAVSPGVDRVLDGAVMDLVVVLGWRD
jgi:hypothetical protein